LPGRFRWLPLFNDLAPGLLLLELLLRFLLLILLLPRLLLWPLLGLHLWLQGLLALPLLLLLWLLLPLLSLSFLILPLLLLPQLFFRNCLRGSSIRGSVLCVSADEYTGDFRVGGRILALSLGRCD